MITDQLQPRLKAVAINPSRRKRLTVVEPRRPGFFHTLRELVRYRRYTVYFGKIFLHQRLMRTWLGAVWLPLRPALVTGSKLLVFGGILGVKAGHVPYVLYFLTATAAWNMFHEAAIWATRSLDLNRATLRNVHVPRLVVILGAAVPSIIDFFINLSFAVAAVLYYYLRVHRTYLHLTIWSPFQILAGLLLILGLGVGLGVFTAAFAARARDIRYLLVWALSFVYFLTPVVYTYQRIPNNYKPLAELNPVTGAMELFKQGLFHTEVMSPKALAVTLVAFFFLWGPALWMFQRREVRNW